MKLVKTLSQIQEGSRHPARVEIYGDGPEFVVNFIHENGVVGKTEKFPATTPLDVIVESSQNWLDNVKVL